MFLKKIEIQGFKSFADRVVISFDHSVVGVVGPNGCGKSNITDAIRWVLGEQSAKSLRGSSMSDVIFAGSEDRKVVNMAEVTLVFDNTSKALNTEFSEVEITRRLHRSTGESEYLINRVNVRLKDIQELTLDSGIGRDSLSMITQGNIVSFAEAKPSERRAIFEEAAGVSKYKKRKGESLNKLNRTQENLSRVTDILTELERQVSPLKRAARKAELYREKKQRLQTIEIAVLVNEIENINQQLEEAKNALFDYETKIVMHETTAQIEETQNQERKVEAIQLDKEITYAQEEIMRIVNEIKILETRKIELDEKRKYALETGSRIEKATELKSLLKEAEFEYQDRLNRLNQNVSAVKLCNVDLQEMTMKQFDLNQKYEESDNMLRRLQNKKELLESLLKQPFIHQAGVQAVMNAQASLNGVLGVVAKCLVPESGYEEAINVALGGSIYNIITKDEASARNAISFLKKNRSGRATFLPVNILKPRFIPNDQLFVCDNIKGYLGVAANFITCENEFNVISESLLGNVLVVDTLENGNYLAEVLKFRYKIVTLDGDVIHKGGSMTGGKQKESSSPLTIQKEYSHIETSIEHQVKLVDKLSTELSALKHNKSELEAQLFDLRLQEAKLEPIVEAKRSKYERLKNDYETLMPKEDLENVTTFADDLIIKLSAAHSRQDEITAEIRLKRERRIKVASESERKDQQIRQLRRELHSFEAELKKIEIDQARMEEKLNHNLQRLASEYQLTFESAQSQKLDEPLENAKDEVAQIRSEIDALGNINMNAPEEFSEVNERYEFLKKQYDELVSSKEMILSAIDEMDEVMIKQFKEMFDKINGELQDTFRQLFGGGKARLIMEDPDDILNTGIDINVQPPGKSVQNIRLFSGGEKTLIAICVLFSILKARPVPLCIFDEVEAALDQGNVERFAKYLKQFSEETQFIVVTHRPGTMSQCDLLYGVTMQKKGVSQMLKVKLTDAQKMAEEENQEVNA